MSISKEVKADLVASLSTEILNLTLDRRKSWTSGQDDEADIVEVVMNALSKACAASILATYRREAALAVSKILGDDIQEGVE